MEFNIIMLDRVSVQIQQKKSNQTMHRQQKNDNEITPQIVNYHNPQ